MLLRPRALSSVHIVLPELMHRLFAIRFSQSVPDDPGANTRALSAVPEAAEIAFESFFRQHEPRITTYLVRLLGDSETACDLCQETFLRAWQQFDNVQQHPAPGAWLFRVATNLALQHFRRRKGVVGQAVPLTALNDPASSDPGNHWVEHEIIRQVLLELPLKQRSLLLLREVYGFSCAEVGEQLGMSLEAAKMALYRARLRFRELYLQKDGATK